MLTKSLRFHMIKSLLKKRAILSANGSNCAYIDRKLKDLK